MPPSVVPDLQVVLAVVIAVFGFTFMIFVADRIVEYIKFRQVVKHPEYLKARAEAEAIKQRTRFIPPTLVPRKVKVLVLREDQILEDMCNYDGDVVRCTKIKMQFMVPENYKPYISVVRGKKMTVTLVFNDRGEAIKVSLPDGEAKAFTPDPRITESVFGSRTLEQIMRRMFYGLDVASLIGGVGLGVFVMIFLVFFVLPILGYPVTIGRMPVEVKVVGERVLSELPPPGNFTIG